MFTRILVFATGVLGVATLLTYGGRWSWACDLLVNFRTHFVLLLGIVLIAAASIGNWRLAGVIVVALALNVWPMFGSYFVSASPPAADARNVRLVEFNVYVRNRGLAGIASYLDSLRPDVVVLEEVTAASANRIAAGLPRLAHRYLVVNQGRGVLILSRWPLITPGPVTQDEEMFGARVDVDLGDRRLRLYGVHLDWPVVPIAYQARNAQLSVLGRELAGCAGACVVVGDFNTTPWSSHFRDLKRVSGFHDCTDGRGLLQSWPSGLPALLRIRIDHCLASPAVSVSGVQVGAGAGSDHLAMINDLSVAPATAK